MPAQISDAVAAVMISGQPATKTDSARAAAGWPATVHHPCMIA
jgi:hypothetical protein